MEKIFKTDMNAFFMKGYTFDYTILTDGQAVSIRLINNKYIDEDNNRKEILKKLCKEVQHQKHEIRESLENEYNKLKMEITNSIIDEKIKELKKEETKKLTKEEQKKNTRTICKKK